MDLSFRNAVCFGMCLGIIIFPGAGCVSKKAAQAQARAAYLAGQRDAILQMNRQQNVPGIPNATATPGQISNVTIVGPVRNPTVPWRQGLTLAQAILNAVYQSSLDPEHILIKRGGEEIRVEPSQLLNGVDIPLQPGDIVLIDLPQ